MNLKKITLAGITVFFAMAASAALINQTVSNLDWNSAVWGDPAAAPTAGNDYVADMTTVRIQADASSGTFWGDSVTINSGATALSKLTGTNIATVSGTFTLNGGVLLVGPNGAGTGTLATAGFIVSADSGIYLNSLANGFIITGGLPGSGDLILGSSFTDTSGRTCSFDSVGADTGAINLTENVTLDFGSDVTFGGSLAIDSISQLNVDQVLTFA
jgi:hypothetical protein